MAEGFTFEEVSGSQPNKNNYSYEDVVSSSKGFTFEDVQGTIVPDISISFEDALEQKEKQ